MSADSTRRLALERRTAGATAARAAAKPIVALALVAGVLGCENERPPPGQPACVGWKTTIGPLLESQCGACHAGADPAGGVALDDYVTAVPLAKPRDATAPLLAVFGQDEVHGALAEVQPTLAQWVISCDAAFLSTALHGAGIMDPDRSDFHARLLEDSGYDFEACADCHGEDYAGGGAEASCLDCHAEGPTDCSTCHGNQERSGAHAAHEGVGALERPSSCDNCHVVPTDPFAPGHFRMERGVIDPPPAEVVLTGTAAWGPPTRDAPVATAEPRYDPSSQTCVNVYCHGGALEDEAAERSTPVWTASQALDCASCHGSPPASHESDRCGDCHSAVSPGPEMLTSLALHLDGRLQYAANDDCGTCHGGANGAPAPDLDGRTARTVPTVGAHGPHLQPRLGFSSPVACEDCHVVPEDILDPGHIDSARPAEVFPGGTGGLSRADGADPQYDSNQATCSGTYCHGGGEGGQMDQSEGRVDVLLWTGFATGQVFCGSCHGIPPTTPPHLPQLNLQVTDCVLCHSSSIDAFGNIAFDGVDSTHVNGVIDVNTGGSQ